MPTITTSDGVRLDYLDGGDPAGPPVVLLAGFRAQATSWDLHVAGPGCVPRAEPGPALTRRLEGRVRGVVSVDQAPMMLNTEDRPYGFYGYTDANRDTHFAKGSRT